jgi:hypothetical protein
MAFSLTHLYRCLAVRGSSYSSHSFDIPHAPPLAIPQQNQAP